MTFGGGTQMGFAVVADADACADGAVADADAGAAPDATPVVDAGAADGVDAAAGFDAADVGTGFSSQPASSPAASSGATARAARPKPTGGVVGDGAGPPQNGQDSSPRRTWRAHAGQGNNMERG